MPSFRFPISRRMLSLLMGLCVLATSEARGQISVRGYARPAAAEKSEPPPSRRHPELRIADAPEIRLGALSPEERREQSRANRFEKRARIGAIRPMPRAAAGAMRFARVPEGSIGLLRVTSPGARGLRVHLQGLSLPPGGALWVSSAANPDEAYGPFREQGPYGDGDLWTPDARGESILIEYFLPAALAGSVPFALPEVGHLFLDANQQQQPGPCHNLVPSEWAEAAKSVGRLQTISAKGIFACTGVLLNTTNNSGVPYFLTANHCVPTQAEAGRLLVRWLDAAGSPTNETTSYGGALLTPGQASDYSLIRLNGVPNGVRFSGWTTAMPGAGTSIASIHHPQDSFQRYSRGRLIAEACPSFLETGFCANFLQTRWESGVTEPGSSGGPLWTGPAGDPRLVGILSGGASSCETPQGTDYFGRFDLAFAAFAHYLTGEGCAWDLTETNRLVKAAGDSFTLGLKAVSQNKGCAWTASSNVPWITIVSPASGNGEAEIRLTVAPNPGADPREGAVAIAGRQFVLTQLGAPGESCAPTLVTIPSTPGPRNLSSSSCRSLVNRGAYAERFRFAGQAGQQLLPSVSSPDFDTMLLILNPDGSILGFNDDGGGGTTSSAILGGPLSGTPIVLPMTGTYTVEVTSFEPGETGAFYLNLLRTCLFRMPVRNFIVPPEGASLDIDVQGPPDCGFDATNAISWIKLPSGGSYTGAQKVRAVIEPATEYAVAAWQEKRVGVFKIAGQEVEIIQQLKCGKFTMLQSAAGYGAGPTYGQLLNFISTGSHCDWTLTTDAPWIKFEGPASGKGPIETRYQIDTVNLAPADRVGRILAGDQAFTITQQGIGANCQPQPIAIGQTVTGTFNPQCKPVVTELALLTAASYYTFPGTAGQQIAISAFTTETGGGQAIDTAYLLPPSKQFPNAAFWQNAALPEGIYRYQFPAAGYYTLPETGLYTIQLKAQRTQPQLSTPHTLTVREVAGSGCDLALSSQREGKRLGGDTGRIEVRAPAGSVCDWTAASLSPWITITSGATGRGTGAVTYSVLPQAGTTPRSGAIVVAGKLVTVTQFSNVAAAVSSASYRPGAAPGSLVTIFGAGLATKTEAAASLPLPLQLAGTSVRIKFFASTLDGFPCGLIFVSPNQLNIALPFYSEYVANAFLEITSGDGVVTNAFLPVTQAFPALFSANASGQGLAAAQTLRVKPDGAQIWEDVFQTDATGTRVPRPIDLGPEGDRVFLVLYGTGIRFAAENPPYAYLQAEIGGEKCEVQYAGPQFSLAGVDQVNVLLPRSLRGRGEVPVKLTALDLDSNLVSVKFAP